MFGNVWKVLEGKLNFRWVAETRKKARVGREILCALGQWGTYDIIIYYVANYVVKVMVEINT